MQNKNVVKHGCEENMARTLTKKLVDSILWLMGSFLKGSCIRQVRIGFWLGQKTPPI